MRPLLLDIFLTGGNQLLNKTCPLSASSCLFWRFSADVSHRLLFTSSYNASRANYLRSTVDDFAPKVKISGKHIPATHSAQRAIEAKEVHSPHDAKILKVSIIGAPNAGKSTLANKLLGRKFATVSKKVHTTREKTVGVLTEDESQIVFVDTPGMIPPSKLKKFKLEKSLLTDPHTALPDADLILVVVDVSHIYHQTKLDPEVLKVLHLNKDTSSVLILNQIDNLRNKSRLFGITNTLTNGIVNGKSVCQQVQSYDGTVDEMTLFKKADVIRKSHGSDSELNIQESDADDVSSNPDQLSGSNFNEDMSWNDYFKRVRKAEREIRGLKGWPGFKEVFMVSALEGDGVNDVKDDLVCCVLLQDYLLKAARPGPWHYSPDLITMQNPKKLATLCLREKLLDNLSSEIPYSIDIKVSMWEEDEGLLRTGFDLTCKSKRHYNSLLGKQGQTIKKISKEVKEDLMNIFHRELTVKLLAVSSEKWKPKVARKGTEESDVEKEDIGQSVIFNDDYKW